MLAGLSVLAPFAFAAENTGADQQWTNSAVLTRKASIEKFSLQILPNYISLASRNGVLFGPGLGFSATYALTEKIGASLYMGQNFASSPLFTAFLSQFSLRGVYAISGKLFHGREIYENAARTIVEKESLAPGGLRAQLSLNQFLMNSATGQGSLTGLGAGIFYELPASLKKTWILGANYSQVVNSGTQVNLIQIFAGVGFWF
jgi:hypothetical protein